MDDGSRLRVRGEGNVGRRGGEPGDLYVFINVRAHPAGLRREGTTIHSDVDVSYVDAILGTTVKVWFWASWVAWDPQDWLHGCQCCNSPAWLL